MVSWRARVSASHVLMIAAGLTGFVVSLTALTNAHDGVDVLVAAHPIPAGHRVERADLRSESLRAGAALLRTMLRRRDLDRVTGYFATTSIEAGELVERGELRPRAAPGGLRAMSISVDPGFAVAGRLARGDRVDVVAAARDAEIVAADVEVLAVDAVSRGGITGSSGLLTITLAVDAEQSRLLASAVADGDIVVTRTTGAVPSAPTEPLTSTASVLR